MFLSNIKFIISAPNKASWPNDNLNEICFLGKSNVGKSTLLNALSNSRIARVSSTPGFTKLINFFEVDNTYRLVDTPGYGYAKTSILNDELFAKMMEEYIFERTNVKLFVLLVDTRRGLEKNDLDCLELLLNTGREVILVGTKSDKLNQSMKAKFNNNIHKIIHNKIKIFPVTAIKKESINELKDYIDKVGRQN